MLLSKIQILFRNHHFFSHQCPILLWVQSRVSLVAQRWTIGLPMQETQAWSLGSGRSLEKEGNHSSTLAWEIPWTVEPVCEVSKESDMTQRLSHNPVTMLHSVSCLLVWGQCSTMSGSVTPWTLQAPLSMEFSRQEYWSGLPFPTPGDLPDPGIEPVSLMSPSLAGRIFTTMPPGLPISSLSP